MLISEWGRAGDLLSGLYQYINKYKPWVIPAVEVVLVLLLAQQLANISWLIIEQTMVGSETHTGLAVSNRNTGKAAEEPQYAQLNSLYLFGRAATAQAKPVKPKSVDLQQIPVSKLRATVTGLVAHPDESRALVVIDSGGQQKTYHIDDEIHKSSATIDEIHWDRVIINNRGQQEALLLYPNDKTSARPMQQSAERRSDRKPVTSLKSLRQQVLSDPLSLMDMVAISPVRSGSELKGYRVNPKQNHSLFAQAGLKPNDLATAINGYDLTDPIQAMDVLSRLKTFKHIALTVERQGQLYQIDLSL